MLSFSQVHIFWFSPPHHTSVIPIWISLRQNAPLKFILIAARLINTRVKLELILNAAAQYFCRVKTKLQEGTISRQLVSPGVLLRRCSPLSSSSASGRSWESSIILLFTRTNYLTPVRLLMPVIFFTNRKQLSVFHILREVLVHLAGKDKLSEERWGGKRGEMTAGRFSTSAVLKGC